METVRARRWTREEFDRMVGAGIFSPGERVELIDGEIVEMTAQEPYYGWAYRTVRHFASGDASRTTLLTRSGAMR